MVLGALAMVVWSCARVGTFHGIVCGLEDHQGITLPVDPHGYLETVEDVHMQLFLAMCSFIAIITVSVFLATRTQAHWRNHSTILLEATRQAGQETAKVWHDIAPEGAKMMFVNFAESKRLLLRRLTKQALMAEAEPESRDDKLHFEVLCEFMEDIAQEAEPDRTFKREDLAKWMEPWFRFDDLIGLHLHYVLEDILEIKLFTWSYLAVGLILSAVIVRGTHHDAAHWIIVILQLALAGAFGFGVPVYMQRTPGKILHHAIAGENTEVTEEEKALRMPHLRMQDFPLFTLQIFIFYWCYTMMRMIASNYWWHNYPAWAVGAVIIWLVSIPSVGFLVGKALQVMAFILARGDMAVHKDHLSWIIVLCERHLYAIRRAKHRAQRQALMAAKAPLMPTAHEATHV